jgi:LysM repeat protein
MGLFGKSFEEKVEEAVQALKAQYPIKGFNAEISDETVTLSGLAPSPEVKAEVMKAFNARVETKNTFNKMTVEVSAPAPGPAVAAGAVVAPAPVQAPAPAAQASTGERIHVVAAGESLSAIAKKYYGNANEYMKIFDANKDILKNPDVIHPGQKLRIP